MKRHRELTLTLPSLLWLLVFFALPCVLILAFAFKPTDVRGGVGEGWSLEALSAVGDPQYGPIVWRTVWMSLLTTVLCVLMALPVSWYVARVSRVWRSVLLLLIILPFLTNFLIRIFAWRSLLHPEGIVKQGLVMLHLATEDSILMNHAGAVLLVMVYTHLPFAILPLYAAAEKFDFSLLEAARDLGAGAMKAMRKVYLPGVRQGLVSACLIVFVSSLGQYVIPQFVGGTGDEMLGNKIAQRAFADRNLPLACALTGALLLAVMIPVGWMAWRARREEAA